ncbi:hypothetical protein [Paenibacillus sp. MMO-58]|uniref:hypothetical protein n=1 Tax=Paenibacillus sp. MMO-58 TaxID=3081290 RepID=UPI00301A1C12
MNLQIMPQQWKNGIACLVAVIFNKTIRIMRAADILIDGKHRIGSSKDNWSIAAPLYNPSEPTATSWFGFEPIREPGTGVDR